MLAVIDQGGYGAQAAAPLVRNIFNYIYTNQDQIAGAIKTPTPASPPSQTRTAADSAARGADDHDDQRARRPQRRFREHDHQHDDGRRLSVP